MGIHVLLKNYLQMLLFGWEIDATYELAYDAWDLRIVSSKCGHF